MKNQNQLNFKNKIILHRKVVPTLFKELTNKELKTHKPELSGKEFLSNSWCVENNVIIEKITYVEFERQFRKKFAKEIEWAEKIEKERKEEKMAKIYCDLCNKEIDLREAHNGMPLTKYEVCSECNEKKVVPARGQNG